MWGDWWVWEQIDKPVVRLRRSIGLKKDEFFVDRKHMTKPEVMNLLESAGFSRSNPYYVVQQGKIQALTVMRDTERLELLKDIGGTKVYDERRKESLKILHETASRQAQVHSIVGNCAGWFLSCCLLGNETHLVEVHERTRGDTRVSGHATTRSWVCRSTAQGPYLGMGGHQLPYELLHSLPRHLSQIEETIDYIDQRLAELNAERAELAQYQEVETPSSVL